MNKKTLAAAGAVVVALGLFLSADSALAQSKDKGKDVKPVKVAKHVKPDKPAKAKPAKVKPKEAKPDKPLKPAKPKTKVRPVFGTHDRDLIRHYYEGLPPGLAKRNGDLPPGLERQLQLNGVLPPGLRARIRPFPAALERQLTPLPYGYRRGILDRHVLVYGSDTYTIFDRMLDVWRSR